MLSYKMYGQKKTFFGVKSGYNYTTTNFNHILIPLNIIEGYKPGLHFGIKGLSYLQKGVGLQFELNYSQKGWTQLFGSNIPKFETEMNYLELPILINLYLGNGKTRFFINLGTYVEYLLSYKTKNFPTDTGLFDFYPYDDSRDNKFGYGYRAGGGIYHDFSFGTVFIEGSFAFGLSDVLNPITDDSGIPNQSNHLVGAISIGYLIELGKSPGE